MQQGTQDDELIRQAALRHSVDPSVVDQLLALAPDFENLNIYGMKVEFARRVEQILDRAIAAKDNGDRG